MPAGASRKLYQAVDMPAPVFRGEPPGHAEPKEAKTQNLRGFPHQD